MKRTATWFVCTLIVFTLNPTGLSAKGKTKVAIPLEKGCLKHIHVTSWGHCEVKREIDAQGKEHISPDRLVCKDSKMELIVGCVEFKKSSNPQAADIEISFPSAIDVPKQ